MTLILLLLVPVLAALVCLAARSRALWERVNLGAFAIVAALAFKTAGDVIAHGTVSAVAGFLRADALSALVICVTAFISLLCSIYAVGYLRRDETAGRVTQAQLRRYYVLTPLFVAAMLLVPLADNLGIMWVAIESTTLASVLLVTFYNQKTSFEAGWKYIIIGSVGISLAGSDLDNDPLTFSVASPPLFGKVTGTPPNVTYRPNNNYFGFDQFSYVASDRTTNSSPATISRPKPPHWGQVSGCVPAAAPVP